LIVTDQRTATLVAASTLSLSLFFTCASSALGETPGTSSLPPATATAPLADTTVAPKPFTISLSENGKVSTIATTAQTVAALLAERNIVVSPDDYLSAAADQPLSDGAKLVYRRAVDVKIRVGKHMRLVRSAAPTVAELLAEQRIGLAPSDAVTPSLHSRPAQDGIVNVVRIEEWVSHVVQSIAPKIEHRVDPTLAAGTTRTMVPGAAGLRETTLRFVRRDGGMPSRTILASRIVREPHPRVIVRGIATYASFASVAQRGFEGAMHFAGSALHMIATAYTAGCYGCSGITASGMRAGFGIIAVDPSVIPLGTKLFIPGYGRAIAGDTGGAIRGRRIDLGFNSYGEAIQWGNRPVTVYVLR